MRSVSLLPVARRGMVLAPLALAVLVAGTGCADTSYAPRPTPEVENLRSTYAIAIGITSAVWLLTLLAALGRGFAANSGVPQWILRGAFSVPFVALFSYSFLGQFGDWMMTGVLSWGVAGTVIIVFGSVLSGLINPIGGVVYPLVLFGHVYPRPEVLSLTLIPVLVGQVIGVVLAIAAASVSARVTRDLPDFDSWGLAR